MIYNLTIDGLTFGTSDDNDGILNGTYYNDTYYDDEYGYSEAVLFGDGCSTMQNSSESLIRLPTNISLCDLNHEMSVVVDLITFLNSHETSWNITNTKTGDHIVGVKYGLDEMDKVFQHEYCFPLDGCYEFDIFYNHGELSPSPVPSLKPSTEGSSSPSSMASVTPSMVPSIMPSVKPSKLLSSSPSAISSLKPSSLSSTEPSMTPAKTTTSTSTTSSPASPQAINKNTVPTLSPPSSPFNSLLVTPMVIAGICLIAVVGFSVYWRRRNSRGREEPMNAAEFPAPSDSEDFRIL